MHKPDLSALDLNLLVVLEALLLERHVTRAARRLHMSQPAVSRALARLRERFDDELLVRSGQVMHPTARAEALLPLLRRWIEDARQLVSPETFEPEHATGVIRLAAPDIITYMLVPALLRRLQREAPGIDLDIVPWSPDWQEQLAGGAVDLTFGQVDGTERGIYTRLLVRNEWATVLRVGHPALRKRWSLETFVALDHLLIGFTTRGGGHVDLALERLRRRRRVKLRMPYVVLSPLVVADSDLVLTTAQWLAEKVARPMGLVVKRPPRELALAPVDLPMVWHERSHRDPRQRWLRATLLELAREAKMVRGTSRTLSMLPRRELGADRRR